MQNVGRDGAASRGRRHEIVTYLTQSPMLYFPLDVLFRAWLKSGRTHWEANMRILAVIGALAIIIAIGEAVFFFGGFYSVAGTAEDPSIVTWALTRVRTASIDRHAQDQPPASINAPASVQAGAKAFAAQGCADMPWRAGRQLGQVLGRAASGSAGFEGCRRCPLSVAVVLGRQERHQHDRHAKLRAGRRQRRRYLVDCRVLEKVAERFGGRLQGLDDFRSASRPANRPAAPVQVPFGSRPGIR